MFKINYSYIDIFERTNLFSKNDYCKFSIMYDTYCFWFKASQYRCITVASCNGNAAVWLQKPKIYCILIRLTIKVNLSFLTWKQDRPVTWLWPWSLANVHKNALRSVSSPSMERDDLVLKRHVTGRSRSRKFSVKNERFIFFCKILHFFYIFFTNIYKNIC